MTAILCRRTNNGGGDETGTREDSRILHSLWPESATQWIPRANQRGYESGWQAVEAIPIRIQAASSV